MFPSGVKRLYSTAFPKFVCLRGKREDANNFVNKHLASSGHIGHPKAVRMNRVTICQFKLNKFALKLLFILPMLLLFFQTNTSSVAITVLIKLESINFDAI